MRTKTYCIKLGRTASGDKERNGSDGAGSQVGSSGGEITVEEEEEVM
jgi:hypothetical protein